MNPHHVVFCFECGSDNLSTPARSEDAFERALHELPVVALSIAVALTFPMILIGTVLLTDWSVLLPLVLSLIIILGGCYWALTFLPAAVRRLGWAAVRRLWRALREGNRGSRPRR